MFRNQLFLGIFALLLVIPLASNSEAKLWDLQIQAVVENSPIVSGERPIVSGIVIDHASKPVPNASLNVKSESMSINTHTSKSGEFIVELGKHERLPGNYMVTISASTDNGSTGISIIQYQVKGEISQSASTFAKLSTPEAKKYLNASPKDFDHDHIGFMLFNYYQKLNAKFLEEQKMHEKIAQEKQILEEQYKIEDELREKAIEEYSPGFGVFSGPEYENYINSLDENVRDVVIEHLNFTKNLFYEAQIIREQILNNGGTAEEAQNAYLEKISTTRETIENLGNNSTEIPRNQNNQETGENATTQSVLISEETSENDQETSISITVDENVVEVDYKESIFSVDVNGKVLLFTVENGQIIQINDS